MLNPLMRMRRPHRRDAARPARIRLARRRAAEVKRRLAEVGIVDEDVAHRMPFQLSGGMCQRVALAAALARDPELLIADEPSTALDVTTQAEIIKLLRRVQRERHMSLILITHDLRLAFSTCERIYVLYAGSLLEVGDAAAVERQPFHPYTLGTSARRNRRPIFACRGSSRSGAPCRAPTMSSTAAASPTAATGRSEICRAGKPPLAARDARPVHRLHPPETRFEARLDALRTAALSAAPITPRRRRNRAAARPRRRARQDIRRPAGPPDPRGEGRIARHYAGRERRPRRRIRLGQDHARALPRRPRDADCRRHPHRRHRGSGFRRNARGPTAPAFGGRSRWSSRIRIRHLIRGTASAQAWARRSAPRRAPPARRRRNGSRRCWRKSASLPRTPRAVRRRSRAANASGSPSRARLPSNRRPRLRRTGIGPRRLGAGAGAQSLQAPAGEHGLSYLFITHDLAVVRQIAERIYVLYLGEIVEEGPTERGHRRPAAPVYTSPH